MSSNHGTDLIPVRFLVVRGATESSVLSKVLFRLSVRLLRETEGHCVQTGRGHAELDMMGMWRQEVVGCTVNQRCSYLSRTTVEYQGAKQVEVLFSMK